MEESRKVEVCYVGAGATAVASVTLMVLATILQVDILRAWGVLAGVGAGVWMVHILICRARRSVVRQLTREIAFALRDQEHTSTPEVTGLSAVR